MKLEIFLLNHIFLLRLLLSEICQALFKELRTTRKVDQNGRFPFNSPLYPVKILLFLSLLSATKDNTSKAPPTPSAAAASSASPSLFIRGFFPLSVNEAVREEAQLGTQSRAEQLMAQLGNMEFGGMR